MVARNYPVSRLPAHRHHDSHHTGPHHKPQNNQKHRNIEINTAAIAFEPQQKTSMRNHRNRLPTKRSPKGTETKQHSKAPEIDLPEPAAHPNRRATAAPPPPAPSNGSTRTQPAPNQLDDHPPPGHVVTAGQTLKHLPHNPARQAPAPNHHRKGGRVGILQTRSDRIRVLSVPFTRRSTNFHTARRTA